MQTLEGLTGAPGENEKKEHLGKGNEESEVTKVGKHGAYWARGNEDQ